MNTRISEGWFQAEDGTQLYCKTWTPDGTPRAVLVYVHGFSDHCNTHYTFFPILASRGIEVRAFDQRGWGRSVTKPSERGLTGPTSLVLSDIDSFLKSIPHTPAPLFLMGHSMGGGEVLLYALMSPPLSSRTRVRGFLAEAPYIGLHPSTEPNPLVVFAGRMVGKLLPRRHMVQKMNSKWLSRDPQVCKEWDEDELCHDTGTLEGMAHMLDRGALLDRMEHPVIEGAALWVGHGSEDRMTSCEATKRFMEKVEVRKGKEFKIYEGFYHKMHAEAGDDKLRYINDVADWILARSDEKDAMETKL